MPSFDKIMANFRPLKRYLLVLIDQLIEKYSLQGPFLDAGCGNGDLTLFLAQKGWQGQAVDVSMAAIKETKKKLVPFKDQISVEKKDVFRVKGQYQTIFLCDVLEHIKDDQKLLAHLRGNLNRGGRIVISVPTHRCEWRWDDIFYGHVRRYEIEEIVNLLKKSNFSILEIWDFTFPVFWFLRRVYTRLIPSRVTFKKDQWVSTIESALKNAWGQGVLARWAETIIWWPPVFWLQKKYKKRLIGSECVILVEAKG